jgi:hypothetical protein
MKHIQHAAEPKYLVVDPHMATLVQIDRNSHAQKRRIRLGPPGRSGLTVATRQNAKQPKDVPTPRLFAALEFGGAFEPTHVVEIQRRSRLDTVVVGVIADIVMRQRAENVISAPLLQYARLLAHNLERRPHSAPLQFLRNPERSVIGRRLDVVFGVEPQHHVNRRLCRH